MSDAFEQAFKACSPPVSPTYSVNRKQNVNLKHLSISTSTFMTLTSPSSTNQLNDRDKPQEDSGGFFTPALMSGLYNPSEYTTETSVPSLILPVSNETSNNVRSPTSLLSSPQTPSHLSSHNEITSPTTTIPSTQASLPQSSEALPVSIKINSMPAPPATLTSRQTLKYYKKSSKFERDVSAKKTLTSWVTEEARLTRLLEIQSLKQALYAEEMLLCPDASAVWYVKNVRNHTDQPHTQHTNGYSSDGDSDSNLVTHVPDEVHTLASGLNSLTLSPPKQTQTQTQTQTKSKSKPAQSHTIVNPVLLRPLKCVVDVSSCPLYRLQERAVRRERQSISRTNTNTNTNTISRTNTHPSHEVSSPVDSPPHTALFVDTLSLLRVPHPQHYGVDYSESSTASTSTDDGEDDSEREQQSAIDMNRPAMSTQAIIDDLKENNKHDDDDDEMEEEEDDDEDEDDILEEDEDQIEEEDEDDVENDDEDSVREDEDEDEDVDDEDEDDLQQEDGDDQDNISNEDNSDNDSSSVSSSEGDDSKDEPGKDRFPYESNIISLSHTYDLVRRLAFNTDTCVYEAYDKLTGDHLAIKLKDEYSEAEHNKELRLLVAVQGHALFPKLYGWHCYVDTKTVAIAMTYSHSDEIDCLFGRPWPIKQYIMSLLVAVQHMHTRNILYRDLKPANLLWDDTRGKATLIDFDIATFSSVHRGRLHRRFVGTDGYMAPEVILVKQCRKERKQCIYEGYDFSYDAYSSGVMLAQLVYRFKEEEVSCDDDHEAKAVRFRARAMQELENLNATQTKTSFDNSALELIVGMLCPEPSERMTITEALNHDYFKDARYNDITGVIEYIGTNFEQDYPVKLIDDDEE